MVLLLASSVLPSVVCFFKVLEFSCDMLLWAVMPQGREYLLLQADLPSCGDIVAMTSYTQQQGKPWHVAAVTSSRNK